MTIHTPEPVMQEHPAHCCQRCGAFIGYLGRFVDAITFGLTRSFHDCAERLDGWEPVSNAPVGPWLRTKRIGEKGENVCAVRLLTLDDEPEWIEHGTGITTVTHHSFLPPTHWRWP